MAASRDASRLKVPGGWVGYTGCSCYFTGSGGCVAGIWVSQGSCALCFSLSRPAVYNGGGERRQREKSRTWPGSGCREAEQPWDFEDDI